MTDQHPDPIDQLAQQHAEPFGPDGWESNPEWYVAIQEGRRQGFAAALRAVRDSDPDTLRAVGFCAPVGACSQGLPCTIHD